MQPKESTADKIDIDEVQAKPLLSSPVDVLSAPDTISISGSLPCQSTAQTIMSLSIIEDAPRVKFELPRNVKLEAFEEPQDVPMIDLSPRRDIKSLP